jgi:hypothetical protein
MKVQQLSYIYDMPHTMQNVQHSLLTLSIDLAIGFICSYRRYRPQHLFHPLYSI